MPRKTDLEQHIRESYDLVRQYEQVLRLSADPKEQARSRRGIEEQWDLIKGYLAEYVPLCERLILTAPEDIAEIAVIAGVSLPQAPSAQPLSEPAPTPSPTRPMGSLLDAFTPYETGLTRLLERLDSDHPRYTEALTLQSRLLENIAQTRRYGDTDALKHARAQIVDSLNRLALETVGVSFNEVIGALEKESTSSSLPSLSVREVDNRSGGVYFEGEGPVHIEGDVVGGDQIKTTHETHLHGPVPGPVHTGSGDIHVGSMQVDADASLETLLAALRKAVASQAPLSVQSKCLQRVNLLAEAITEIEPDLGLMESALGWFQKHVPSLASAVVAVIFHPAVVQAIEAAGKPAFAEFQRRFEGLGKQRRLTDE